LPTSVLEGLLSWCVVVATDVWWTPEISKQDDLILVKPGDEESLYLWLEKAIADYKKIAGLSKQYVRKEFDWDKNIEKYYEIYKSLI
jgi:glycosyltransferase involved in cell wall biosynthesis